MAARSKASPRPLCGRLRVRPSHVCNGAVVRRATSGRRHLVLHLELAQLGQEVLLLDAADAARAALLQHPRELRDRHVLEAAGIPLVSPHGERRQHGEGGLRMCKRDVATRAWPRATVRANPGGRANV